MSDQNDQMYKVLFHNQGQIYEVYARSIYQSDLYGFIEVEDYVFGSRTQVVIDPGEDKLRKLNDATNKIIAGYADDKQVFYLNINETFLTDDGVLTKEVMPDLLHPHEKGYGMWAAAMEPTIKKLLAEE